MSARFFNYEEQIKRLKDDLYLARINIISVAPDELVRLLHGYATCDSRERAYLWLEEVAREIIPHAKILTREEGSVFGERAYCPLCRQGSTAAYDRGYSIPEGLYRHLIGYGNVHQCVVTEAAFKLALEHLEK